MRRIVFAERTAHTHTHGLARMYLTSNIDRLVRAIVLTFLPILILPLSLELTLVFAR